MSPPIRAKLAQIATGVWINPRRAVFEHLLQVFRRYLKNGVAECRRFWYTSSYIFSARVVKISDPGHSRSGHQVTSSDLTSEKV